MKVERRLSVVINRPIEEVFAYVATPENSPEWVPTVTECEVTSKGPLTREGGIPRRGK